MTIYRLDIFLSQFGTSLLFHVWSICCLSACIQVSTEASKVVWYSHLFKNFPQFVVIHTVKGFQFSHSVMSISLRPHGLWHVSLPCPSLTPGSWSNSCPLSWWWSRSGWFSEILLLFLWSSGCWQFDLWFLYFF